MNLQKRKYRLLRQSRRSKRAGRKRALIAMSRKGQAGANVLQLKFRKVGKNLGLAHAFGQPAQNVMNRDPHAADARLAAALARLQRDSISKVHGVFPVGQSTVSLGPSRFVFQRGPQMQKQQD